MRKNVIILGSNTDLGAKVIDFLLKYKHKYQIVGLTYDNTANNFDLFIKQIKTLNPKSIYLDKQEDYKLLQEKEISDKIHLFVEEDSFIKFLKSTEIDLVVSNLRGSCTVKKILSAIHEYKDITLLNSSPILYSGSIIPQEARSKGVSLNICTYPMYSLAQFIKFRKSTDIDSLHLFISKHKDDSKVLDTDDYKTYLEFNKKYNSVTKLKMIYEMYLANYLYAIKPSTFNFYEQNKSIISIAVQFNDGSNLINATRKEIDNIFNYYFLDSDLLLNNNQPIYDTLNLSISKLNLKDYDILKLGVSALETGGSLPIIYYMVVDTLIEMMYNKTLKKGTSIYKVVEEFISKKELVNKKPDLGSIFALEKKIKEELQDKYSTQKKK